MVKPKFEEGIMACPCGSSQFWIQFKEVVSHKLNALEGADGWVEPTELLEGEGPDEILGIVCYECDIDLEVTPEAEAFIRKIGG